MTQSETILNWLKDGNALSPRVALEMFGVFRLAARVNELRQQGHDIRTKMVEVPTRNGRKAHVAVYRLA